jgi:cytochrome c biogenesis protein
MSAIEETKTESGIPAAPRARTSAPVLAAPLTKLLKLLSSVRFGVTLLVLLVIACMIGMLIMQQNVEGFEKYYAELTPSQKLVYGNLGFFDIYHVWYFNALLLVLSLNIVLASIDRFPGAWVYISRRKLEASRPYILNQKQNASLTVRGESRSAVAERISKACRSVGLRATVTEREGRTHVFAERGAWNRLGAYAVHVALLTIFMGFFLTSQFGREGQMPLMPGKSASTMMNLAFELDQIKRVPVAVPFTVTCLDIQQKLIKKDGTIQANNTIDWLTRIKITDEYGEREGLVHLNVPYDYRGYRFFQASFTSFGMARHVTLRLMPAQGASASQEVTIKRDGEASLSDGTKIVFEDFQPDFTMGQGGRPDSRSGEYNNPAAILMVTSPSGEKKRAYAFEMDLPDGAPVSAPVFGYKYKLVDFEKVPLQHVLAVQKDPGRLPFYVGSVLLIAMLCAVFFFSHQRVWAVVEEGDDPAADGFKVALGGNTNRNKIGFEDRFKKLIKTISGQTL